MSIKNMKRQIMAVLALAMMIAVLAVSKPVMAACQVEGATTIQEEDTTNQGDNTTAASFTVRPEAFTTVTAWGDNTFGQLGNGTPLPFGDNSNTPVEVSNLDGADLKALAGGASYSLTLKNDGTVWAWGLN